MMHRLIVLGHGARRLLDAAARWDERPPLEMLALRVMPELASCHGTPSDLKRSLLCRSETASAIARRLLRERLLERTVSGADRRSRAFRLTREGHLARQTANDLITGAGEQLLRALPDRDGHAAALARLELAVRQAIFEYEMSWGTDFRHKRRRRFVRSAW